MSYWLTVVHSCASVPMQQFAIRKLANAFVSNAELSDQIQGSARLATSRYQKKYGGFWVGGVVELTQEGITFTPNALNRKLHKNLEIIELPISDIEVMQRNFGWFTGIVLVQHKRGDFKFRCYGAKNVVERYLAYIS